jgi:hypothetical protein
MDWRSSATTHTRPPAPQTARNNRELARFTSWYSSTKICLEKFWKHVLPGGIILVDDYYTWDGCAHAVHEFLHVTRATVRVRQGRIEGTAFIVKL